MSACRIDYANLADSYAQGRKLSCEKETLWLAVFQQHLALGADSRVLDVGCGTGRFAIPVAKELRCSVVGIDPSPSMLAKAKQAHSHGIEWILATAEALPLRSGVFDACLASQVIHHFGDRRRAFGEICRVLRLDGRAGFRFSSHAQLRAILDYKFFPSALELDLNRLPDIEVIRRLVRAAGFRTVEEHVVRQKLFDSPEGYLEKLRCKYASALTLISEEEHREGLKKAALYLERGELKTAETYADVAFLVGVK